MGRRGVGSPLGLGYSCDFSSRAIRHLCTIYRDTRYGPEPARQCYDIPLGGSNTGIASNSEEDTNDCGLASAVPHFVGGRFARHHFYCWLQEETRSGNSAAAAPCRTGAPST